MEVRSHYLCIRYWQEEDSDVIKTCRTPIYLNQVVDYEDADMDFKDAVGMDDLIAITTISETKVVDIEFMEFHKTMLNFKQEQKRGMSLLNRQTNNN